MPDYTPHQLREMAEKIDGEVYGSTPDRPELLYCVDCGVPHGDTHKAECESWQIAAMLRFAASQSEAHAAEIERLKKLVDDMATAYNMKVQDFANETRLRFAAESSLRAEREAMEGLVATFEDLLDHMDRAGGDRDGMPECPWCHAGPGNSEDDEKYHYGDCELVAARAVLAASPAAPTEKEQ